MRVSCLTRNWPRRRFQLARVVRRTSCPAVFRATLLLAELARLAGEKQGEVSYLQVFVARLLSAAEKQPQRLENAFQISPDTSTQALGERTVCIEPARSTRV
jgi:hypothetical protein